MSYASECLGKVRFPGRSEAKRAARRIGGRTHGRRSKAYRCDFCGLWHIGKWHPQARAHAAARLHRQVRDAVLRRSANRCERCGLHLGAAVAYSLQHRRARGMGGTSAADADSVVNLAALCGTATTGCHGWVEQHPAESLAGGWRVRQGDDPGRVPVVHWELGLVFLTADSAYREVGA